MLSNQNERYKRCCIRIKYICLELEYYFLFRGDRWTGHMCVDWRNTINFGFMIYRSLMTDHACMLRTHVYGSTDFDCRNAAIFTNLGAISMSLNFISQSSAPHLMGTFFLDSFYMFYRLTIVVQCIHTNLLLLL